MSKYDRRKRLEDLAAAAFCALPVIGATLLLYPLGVLNGRDTERRHLVAASYTQDAKADAEHACANDGRNDLFECVYEKVEASQEQARSEQELTAQQNATSSSIASSAIAFFSLALSAIGIWYVRGTLRETRRAVEATLKAAEETAKATDVMAKGNAIADRAFYESARPYLLPKSLYEFDGFSWRDGRKDFSWPFVFENHGKGPAILKEMKVGCCLSDIIPPLDMSIRISFPSPRIGVYRDVPWYEEETFPPNTIVVGGSSTEQFSRSFNRNVERRDGLPADIIEFRKALRTHLVGPILKAWLIGYVQYEDIYGRSHHTHFCWQMNFPFDRISVAGGQEYNAIT